MFKTPVTATEYGGAAVDDALLVTFCTRGMFHSFWDTRLELYLGIRDELLYRANDDDSCIYNRLSATISQAELSLNTSYTLLVQGQNDWFDNFGHPASALPTTAAFASVSVQQHRH